MIEIWGKPFCPSCMRAKKLCEEKSYKFSYKELDKDFSRDEVLSEFPGAKTFPQIKVNESKVGGYEKFVKYIEDTGYGKKENNDVSNTR